MKVNLKMKVKAQPWPLPPPADASSIPFMRRESQRRRTDGTIGPAPSSIILSRLHQQNRTIWRQNIWCRYHVASAAKYRESDTKVACFRCRPNRGKRELLTVLRQPAYSKGMKIILVKRKKAVRHMRCIHLSFKKELVRILKAKIV